ncbi:MAG: GTP 3',8-cyclase MoaA [Bacteroidota bacterium]|nr:GTP 3',8-cyclase MoaA [Bacteroidota bacterium]
MPDNKLIDSFGRTHEYLRISLTDACNLRCMYCMPNETIEVTQSSKMMNADEIETIAKKFVELGIKKIRLTGGEPLIRKDAKDIIQRLSKLPVELTISTNAVFVNDFIETFKEAKMSSINVSLDTLNEEEFFRITKRGDFKKIMSNIHLLLQNDFRVKVNMVVMKGMNEDAVSEFVAYTKDYPIEVRFIEFMPFAGNKWNLETVVSYDEMLEKISSTYTVEKLPDDKSDTTRKYKVKGHKGSFGFIATITQPFCESCNRLRLTADGKMKNCLFSQTETDLLATLRRGKDIEQLILSTVYSKKEALGGQQTLASKTAEQLENRSMIKIGG